MSRSFAVLTLAALLFAGARPESQAPVPREAPPPIHLGTAWYPEHWPESRWPEDLRLMREAGLTVVRVGEFAWSRLEPADGRFDLDWLDRAIRLAGAHGLSVVIGTPTAAPPAWLTYGHPETFRVDADGRPAQHGNRTHFSFTSPRYREYCRKVASAMAERWGHAPNVIGWQIDNEYGAPSYDRETARQFQEWLHAKYGTLDALNERWSTSYWSQTYFAWSQIPIPIGAHNPALMLEWKRFVSDTWRSYQKVQLDAIRARADRRQWITHNFMGWFDGFDHYTVAADLDIASWDDYAGARHLEPLWNGLLHDLTRGFKRKPFWVMETQPGSVNWADVNMTLDKGEVRAMAWHAIGHGADAVSYWQWRSAPGGQEQYHGSLVAQDGTPRPLYAEVQQVGREFAAAGGLLAGTAPHARVAMLHSYDDRWAINFQRHHKDFDPGVAFTGVYRMLRRLVATVVVVSTEAPLDGYRLVVAPSLLLVPDALGEKLAAWVRGGGHLVLGPRSGTKNTDDALLPVRQPGPVLAPLLGARVEDYYALDAPVPVSGTWGAASALVWAERLRVDAPDVEVLLTYGTSNGWLDGQPAVVSRVVGKGRMTYIGAGLPPAVLDRAAEWISATTGLTPEFPGLSQGVEVNRRVGDGKEVLIVVNHTAVPQRLTLPKAMANVLTGARAGPVLDLGPRDVAVLDAR
jgi:beta-galactosidase